MRFGVEGLMRRDLMEESMWSERDFSGSGSGSDSDSGVLSIAGNREGGDGGGANKQGEG